MSEQRNPVIVELLARDGLQTMVHEQNWTMPTTTDKVEFIRRAAAAGVPEIEITGFVHPKVIPQLADAEEVARQTAGLPNVTLRALVPNMKGAIRAVEAGVHKLSCLIVASETYQRKNSNMTIAENRREIERIVELGRREGREVSVGMGICFLCPYEGKVPSENIAELVEFFVSLGISEVSIADSIGHASPSEVTERVDMLLQRHPHLKLGLHLHDMSGMAISNVYAGWKAGATIFETCTGGYGGGIAMPISVNGMGNVPTEDVVNLFHSMGVETGIDLDALRATGKWFSEVIGVPSRARVARNGTYADLLAIGQRLLREDSPA
jgi:hydroxymethylglutaryl-CoA lyase